MIYHPPKLSQDKSRIWVWLDYLVKWATSERVYIKGRNFEHKESGKYFIPPNIPPSGGGLWPWMYPTHVELDPTLTYSKGTCAYLSPQNPLVTVGLVDLDSTVLEQATAGIVLALVDIPAKTVSGYNVPKDPVTDLGVPSGTPLTGNLDGGTAKWVLIKPVC